MHIHDRVWLADDFPAPITICTTFFPHPINHMHSSFSPPHNLLHKVVFNLVYSWQGKVVYSWQGKVGCVFPQMINHNSFSFSTRLMFNLVRVGKEWVGPVFPHPLKSKGYICIDDRVRLAVFLSRQLTICTTVFPHPITFWTRLMFNLVRVGKEWDSPVFPHPKTNVKGERNLKAYCASKWRTVQTMNFDTNLNKIGVELRKLWTTEYFNIGGMGTAILNIKWGFTKFKNHFLKVVLLVNLIYFGENDCLSLELNIYKYL